MSKRSSASGYRPAADAGLELDALVAIYCRAIERYEESQEEKKGGCPTAPDDAEGRSNAIDARPILPQQE